MQFVGLQSLYTFNRFHWSVSLGWICEVHLSLCIWDLSNLPLLPNGKFELSLNKLVLKMQKKGMFLYPFLFCFDILLHSVADYALLGFNLSYVASSLAQMDCNFSGICMTAYSQSQSGCTIVCLFFLKYIFAIFLYMYPTQN